MHLEYKENNTCPLEVARAMQASGELGAPLFRSLTSSSLIFYFAHICIFKLEVCRSDIEDHVPQGSQNLLDNMVVQCFFEVYIGTMLKKDMIGEVLLSILVE